MIDVEEDLGTYPWGRFSHRTALTYAPSHSFLVCVTVLLGLQHQLV